MVLGATRMFLALGWLAAVSGAAAFTLARILAFATVIAGFATALTLAGVLSLASVLFLRGTLIVLCDAGLEAFVQIRCLEGRTASREKARYRGRNHEAFHRFGHSCFLRFSFFLD